MSEVISQAPGAPPTAPNVGVVGHSQAGKTVYIASLQRALRQRKWKADYVESQQTYLKRLIDTLQSGEFPKPTSADENPQQVEMVCEKGDHKFTLSLLDPAGELFETEDLDLPEEKRKARREGRQFLEQNLANCTGFLILLDLEHKNETFTQTVDKFLNVVNQSRGKSGGQSRRRLRRAAVLFSKADLLPWQDRYRIRSAAEWVRDPANKITDMPNLLQDNFEEVRFEFISTIGWNQGLPNVRTRLTPRSYTVGNLETNVRGEHLPDPALPFEQYARGKEDEEQFRFMKALPLFTDPLRVVAYQLPEVEFEHAPKAGVQFFPGRRREMSTFAPWNVVDPLLWAAEATN